MNNRVMVVAAGVGVCLAGLVSGCSSSGSTSPKNSSSTTSPRTAVATTSAASPSGSGSGQVSAAAQQYLGITAAANSDLQAFLAQPNTAPMPQVRAAAGKIAGDETILAAALQKASWPGPVRQTISNLEATIRQEQAVYEQCATAASVGAVKAVLVRNQGKIAARAAASAQVRAALGLPNPTPPSRAANSTPSTTTTA